MIWGLYNEDRIKNRDKYAHQWNFFSVIKIGGDHKSLSE